MDEELKVNNRTHTTSADDENHMNEDQHAKLENSVTDVDFDGEETEDAEATMRIIDGEVYESVDDINLFLKENDINLDSVKLERAIYNSLKVTDFNVQASIISVDVDCSNLIPLVEQLVPGTLKVQLIAKTSDNEIVRLGAVQWNAGQATVKSNLNRANGGRPLAPDDYLVYFQVSYQMPYSEHIQRVNVPLGSVIKEGLQRSTTETELYYYSGKLQLKNKLLYMFNAENNTLRLQDKKLLSINPSELYGDIKNQTKNPGRLYKAMVRLGFPLIYLLVKMFPVKKQRVFFASDSRSELGGNFQFIDTELKRQGYDDIHYIFNENQFVRKSFAELCNFAWLCATSNYIFIEENHQMFEHIKLKKNVFLIQTWHAAGAFKTFGYSRMGMPGGPKIDAKAHRYYDYATVSSKAMVPIYAEAFDMDADRILPLGVPRTDLFYDDKMKQEKIDALDAEYDFTKQGKKIILFAPTFRGGTRKSAYYPFEYLDFAKLYQELHEDYVFLIKVHFNTLNKINIPAQYSDFLYDVSDYRDINDLMLISDIMITDYSSVAFEYSLLNKPMLFFAFDLDEYISTRGFYYDYKSFVPGKIVKSTTQMIDAIDNNDFEIEKIPKFRDFFFTYQDGKASKRIVDYFITDGDEHHLTSK